MITETDILQTLSVVMHPAINHSLMDLGLLCVYKETVMNEEEKARFKQMEAQAWKGL